MTGKSKTQQLEQREESGAGSGSPESRELKSNTQYSMALVLLVSGIVLCYLGFYKEPVGSISSSVLQYFAECLIWAASVFGLTAYVDVRIHKALKSKELNPKS